MTEKEFKQKCKNKKIYYSIALWNAYIDKCWLEIEREYNLALDNKKARGYNITIK